MGTVFGATETVPKRAVLAFFTARARPAVRAMPRVKIIETRLKRKYEELMDWGRIDDGLEELGDGLRRGSVGRDGDGKSEGKRRERFLVRVEIFIN